MYKENKRPAESSGQSQAVLLHSHDNPTEGKREIMMTAQNTARSQILMEELTNQRKSLLRTKEFPITRKSTKKNGSPVKNKCKNKHQKLPKAPVDSY